MPKILGFQRSVPSSWTAGEPRGGAGVRLSHPTPYLDAEAMPGTYYTPGAHPYETRLPNGLIVQEAYPGQYYVPGPVGIEGLGGVLDKFRIIEMSPIICAIIGAAFGGGVAFGLMRKKPKKSRNTAIAAGASAGAALGFLICGKKAAPTAPGVEPTDMPGEVPPPPPPAGGPPSRFAAPLLLPQITTTQPDDLFSQIK